MVIITVCFTWRCIAKLKCCTDCRHATYPKWSTCLQVQTRAHPHLATCTPLHTRSPAKRNLRFSIQSKFYMPQRKIGHIFFALTLSGLQRKSYSIFDAVFCFSSLQNCIHICIQMSVSMDSHSPVEVVHYVMIDLATWCGSVWCSRQRSWAGDGKLWPLQALSTSHYLPFFQT